MGVSHVDVAPQRRGTTGLLVSHPQLRVDVSHRGVQQRIRSARGIRRDVILTGNVEGGVKVGAVIAQILRALALDSNCARQSHPDRAHAVLRRHLERHFWKHDDEAVSNLVARKLPVVRRRITHGSPWRIHAGTQHKTQWGMMKVAPLYASRRVHRCVCSSKTHSSRLHCATARVPEIPPGAL
jgi:hypothetical protein